jgi:hypothetical protein
MREVLIGRVYHHFKGHDAKVLNIALHTETEEKMVVYEHSDTGQIWVRPYEMFNGLVDKEKYPEVKQKYRFELKNEGGKENG